MSTPMFRANGFALMPMLVFAVLYLGLGITFEYGLDISLGFYKIPIVIIFMVSIVFACCQNRSASFDEKLAIMARGVGNKLIVTMLLIFIMAGVFVGVVGRESAESVAYALLVLVPPEMSVAMLFVASCLISLSMGTSVGTITLIVPIAVQVAEFSGVGPALCVASVMGGAMFGDNLSFISDTTIAACNGQGIRMKDKFRVNFKVALPAALIALAIIIAAAYKNEVPDIPVAEYDLVMAIPYVIVLFLAIAGMNVFAVLAVGIVSGIVLMSTVGSVPAIDLLTNMGTGAQGMFETSMVAILAACLCELIKENGGFEYLLRAIRRLFRGMRGGKLGIGLLVCAIDVVTANNTVAIVIANPVAKAVGEQYGINGKETASVLDTFSCVMQGILPYGAQMLIALSIANGEGVALSAFDVIPHLYYPFALLGCVIIWIAFGGKNSKKSAY